MNNTKIEWATKTWNPVTGCNRGCPYCYAKGIARRFGGQVGGRSIKANPMLHDIHKPFAVIRKNRKIIKAPFPFDFEPTFHRYRLDEPLQKKKPQNIFVSSMGDLFGPWIPDEWIQAVFNACKQATQPVIYDADGNIPTVHLCGEVKNANAGDFIAMDPGELSATITIKGLRCASRKRFVKLLMGHGWERNAANIMAEIAKEEKISYQYLLSAMWADGYWPRMEEGSDDQ